MTKPTFAPHSREQDQEIITRSITNFSGGINRDSSDVEAQGNSLLELTNARGYQDSVKGRNGSSLLSEGIPIKTPLSITHPNQSDYYLLNNRLYRYDTVTLQTVALGGFFSYIEIIAKDTDGEDIFIYLSTEDVDGESYAIANVDTSVRVDLVNPEFTYSIVSNFYDQEDDIEYVLYGHPVFNDTYLYAHINGEYRYIVSKNIGPCSSSNMFKIDKLLYVSTDTGLYGMHKYEDNKYNGLWKANYEIPEYKLGEWFTEFPDKEANTQSKSSCTSAYNYAYTYSRFRNKYDKNRNSSDELLVLETPPYLNDKDDPFKGGIEDENFMSIDAPNDYRYYADGNNNPYTTIFTKSPIETNTFEVSPIEKGPMEWLRKSDDYQCFMLINHITNTSDSGGELTTNTTKYKVYVDFTNVESYDDIALEITSKLKEIDDDLRCFNITGDKSDDNYFKFYSRNTTDKIEVISEETLSPVDGEFDIVYANGIIANRLMSDSIKPRFNAQPGIDSYLNSNRVSILKYPDGNQTITHYSLYRSKDIYQHTLEKADLSDPATLGNKSYSLAWIEDQPVCKIISGTIDTAGYGSWKEIDFSNSTQKLTQADIWDTFYYVDDTEEFGFRIREVDEARQVALIDGEFGFSIPFTVDMCATGVRSINKASVDTTPTVIENYGAGNFYEITLYDSTGSLISGDEYDGNIIFWEDGTYDNIALISNGLGVNGYFLMRDPGFPDMTPIGADPNARTFNDSVNDNRQNGNFYEWPLNTMFYTKFPNIKELHYSNGVLIASENGGVEKDESTLHYTGAADYRHMGYYNKAYQRKSNLESPIRAISNAGSQITVFTDSGTHTINPYQGFIEGVGEGSQVGSSYLVLPDTVEESSTIGVPNSSRVTNGPDNSLIVMSSEPALRLFNGQTYSEDFSDGLIKKSDLVKLDEYITLDYDNKNGITIWGGSDE
jgi:hypothetical protein